MNPDSIAEYYAEFNKNITKEELTYLETYAYVKELINKPEKTSEDIENLVGALKYLTEMKPLYDKVKKSGSR